MGAGGVAGTTGPTREAPLDAEQIFDCALALLERDGLAGVTMRRLADRLAVAPSSLYWHVPDREKLLGQMAARLLDRCPPEEAGIADWRERVARLAARTRGVLDVHADAATLVSMQPDSVANLELRYRHALRGSGLAAEEAGHAAALLTAVTLSCRTRVDAGVAATSEHRFAFAIRVILAGLDRTATGSVPTNGRRPAGAAPGGEPARWHRVRSGET